jgi:hypothetical protein
MIADPHRANAALVGWTKRPVDGGVRITTAARVWSERYDANGAGNRKDQAKIESEGQISPRNMVQRLETDDGQKPSFITGSFHRQLVARESRQKEVAPHVFTSSASKPAA